MPNQLLQLLRPFIPASPDSDKRFVHAFSLPLLRTSSTDSSEATSAVLQILNTYKDISEDTALRILADEYLGKRLQNLEVKSPQFVAEVDQRLARDLQSLTTAHTQLVAKVSVMEASLLAREEQLARADARTRAQQEASQLGNEREVNLKAEIDRTKREKEDAAKDHETAIARQRRNTRLVAGFALALLGILMVTLGPGALQMHHKLLAGLQFEACVFFLGSGWAVADESNWRTILIGVAVVALAAIGTLVASL
jgi:cation transport ATPase